MLPTIPLVVVLVGVACADVVVGARRSRNWFHWLVPVPPLLLAGMMAVRMDHRLINDGFEDTKLGLVAGQTANVNSYLHAAGFLAQVVPPGGRLVTDYGGIFAYYTDATVIEMWGLANATIATRGGTEGVRPIYGRTCPACYPELQPEYFHVMQPMVRREPAFLSADQVITNVWQTDTIGRYVDFRGTFAVGRAVSPSTGEALYFLQKRDRAFVPARRTTAGGLVVDYPFEKVL